MHFHIVFRGVKASDAVEGRIRERAARLQRLDPSITGCHVVVHAPHQRQRHGNVFDVRLHAQFPGGAIEVGGTRTRGHADLYAAITDTFDAAERRLLGKLRRQEHRANRDVPMLGRITELAPVAGYGFIQSADGYDVYFNHRSVIGRRFGELAVGDAVQVAFHDSDLGLAPKATSVRPVTERRMLH